MNTVAFSEPIPLAGLRTYVTFSVSASPTDGVTVQAELPLGGIQVVSGNDGPIDQVITNGAFQEISTDPLITTLSADRMTYSTGQTIGLTMFARNEGIDTLTGVAPSALTASGSGSALFSAGPTPASVDLLPGEDTTFVWIYTAQTAGDVELCAFAQTADSLTASQSSCTGVFSIHNRAVGIPVTLSNLAPATANQGQDNVQLLGVSIDYLSGDSLSVPLDLEGLKITIEDGTGTPIPPNQILENAILTDPNGTDLVFSVVDSLTNPLHLYLQTPITVGPGQVTSIGANCDIASTATFTPFRIRVDALGDVRLFDANDGATVSTISSNTFPWQTTLITINSPAESLLVSTTSGQTIYANTGQTDLSMFSVDFLSPGTPNTAREIVTDLTLNFTDTAGVAIVPSTVVTEIRLMNGSQTLATQDVIPSVGSSIAINLATPLILTPGVRETMDVLVDLRSVPVGDGFQLHVNSPTEIVGRDINTSQLIAVAAQSPATQDFPFTSDTVVFQSAASGVLAQYVDRMPQSILPSTVGIPIMDITLTHQDTTSASSLSVDSLSLEFRTSSGAPIYPGDYFSSLIILHGIDTVSVVSSLSSVSPIAECNFSQPVPIDPAQSEVLSIFITSKGFFSATDLEVRVEQQYLAVFDTNDGSRIFGISGAFPFVAGPGNLLLPSNQVLVGLTSRLPANVSAQQPGVPAFDLYIQNGLTQGFTDTGLRTVRVEIEDGQGNRMDPTTLLGAATLTTSNSTPVPGTLGTADIVFNVPDSLVIIPSGLTDTVAVSLDMQTGLSDVNFRLVIPDSASIDVVELNAQTPIATGTLTGLGFPLATNLTHVLGTSAEAAFTNYPNPFAAGREGTTVTYYLDTKSTVSLKLLTLWGAPVATLVDNQSLDPGLYQNVVWDGRNGDGDTVNNGVYYLVLEINGSNGTHKTLKRKVGVIR
jgi:hypothetical protein